MATTKELVWTDFLAFIRKQCNRVEYANWIAPINCISCNDDSITLETPNVFVKQYLLDNYKEALATFFPTDHKGEPQIRFIICEKKRTSKKQQREQQITPNDIKKQLKLNPYYTFDYFIEGPSNQFIKSAAVGVALRPGKAYNPLFIYGGVGLGKTHILHAIGHYSEQKKRKLRVQCISTEGFH